MFSLTQDCLWMSILIPADGLFRILYPACDELPLLAFKKSHSDLQRHHNSSFSSDTIAFHFSRLVSIPQFLACFTL